MYSKRFRNTYNTLAAAAICLLVYDTNLLFDVGFQLSFTAVTGIVYLQPKIYEMLSFEWKVSDYFWQITSVGIAAQIATFPVGLYYFHHFPLNFLLTGLFVVPFAFLILSMGIALFIANYISTTIAGIIGYILYWTIWINNSLIHFVYLLPTSQFGELYIGVFGLALIYILLFLFDRYLTSAKSKYLILMLNIILVTLITSFI